MAIPKFEDFLFPFMMHLTDQDSNKADMVSVLSDFFNLSEEDRNLKTKGGSTPQVYDRVGWCLQWLRRANFVEIPEKGVWRITQRGREYMKNATDLRESDLLKYPEFAEYSGRRNERKRQSLSSVTSVSAIDVHNENWKEIVEVLSSALEEHTDYHMFFNSVFSCLRLLGWKKSNGTIQIEPSNNNVDGNQCIFLVHDGNKRIPCIVFNPNNADKVIAHVNYIASYLDGILNHIGLLFGNCLEVYFREKEEREPTCVASIKLDYTVPHGDAVCNLLEYNTFNYQSFILFCKHLLKVVPNEANLVKRLQEIATDTDFISSKIKEVLVSEGYEESLILNIISPLSFKIKIKTKEQENGKNEKTESVSGTHDNTKFSLDGDTYLNKRSFVLAVIKRYVSEHPYITYEELESLFPSETHSRKRGVVRPLNVVTEWIKDNPDLKKRYFLSPEDIIQLQDGTRVVVNNQWGTHFPKFLKIAQSLYSVQSDQPYSGLEEVVETPVEHGILHGIRISADSISKFNQK